MSNTQIKSPSFIAVDFDGTVVTHEYPRIGVPVPNAIETLKKLQAAGHRIILYTMRSKKELYEAVSYLHDNGISLFGVNGNPTQQTWTSSPKVYAHLYIDDAALGTPLTYDPALSIDNNREYVNWYIVESILKQQNYI
jgi:hydroxymethylpyrimidine pyrophosphatase-like HAD family hydrolase